MLTVGIAGSLFNHFNMVLYHINGDISSDA